MFSRNRDISDSEEASTDWPRPRPLLTLGEMAFLIIALLIPSCGGFYRANYYSHFVQSTCTITGEVVRRDYTHTKYSYYYYTPSFTYTVSVPGTSGVNSSGYDGPDRTSFDYEPLAWDIVNQYPVGTTTTCWYNPANPQEAFLAFHGYSQERAWGVFRGTFIIIGLIQLVTMLIWYLSVRKFLILHKRGQMTRGQVVRQEIRRNKKNKDGAYTVSIIEYTGITPLKRPVRGKLEELGALSLDSQIPVCYDPYRPTRAKYGDRPNRYDIRDSRFIPYFLLVVTSGFACLITFLAV